MENPDDAKFQIKVGFNNEKIDEKNLKNEKPDHDKDDKGKKHKKDKHHQNDDEDLDKNKKEKKGGGFFGKLKKTPSKAKDSKTKYKDDDTAKQEPGSPSDATLGLGVITSYLLRLYL